MKQKTRKFSKSEIFDFEQCIKEMLSSGTIELCEPISDQVISPIFLIDKPSGRKRFIINLRRLNNFVKKEHFKMDDWRTVVKLMQKDWFMCTIDLKDAYYLIPIHQSSRKYLRFEFKNDLYEFCCLPFGLSSAPYVFTKIMKPIVSFLHKQGICCSIYLDDLIVLSKSRKQNHHDTNFCITLLNHLGFLVNFEKSFLKPQKQCKYLGFLFSTLTMSIELPEEKKSKILNTIDKLLGLSFCRISFFAHLIGLLVSVLPTMKYGLLYLKNLEREKILALKRSNQNYNKTCK